MGEETRLEKLQRLGLAPGNSKLFEGGGVVLQGASKSYADSLSARERAELAALRAKRANSPGGLLAGNELDRLEWLERYHGKE